MAKLGFFFTLDGMLYHYPLEAFFGVVVVVVVEVGGKKL